MVPLEELVCWYYHSEKLAKKRAHPHGSLEVREAAQLRMQTYGHYGHRSNLTIGDHWRLSRPLATKWLWPELVRTRHMTFSSVGSKCELLELPQSLHRSDGGRQSARRSKYSGATREVLILRSCHPVFFAGFSTEEGKGVRPRSDTLKT